MNETKQTEAAAPEGRLDALVGPVTAAWMREYQDGIRSTDVGRRLGFTTARARRLLDRCVALGLLERDPRYSYDNCAAWRVTQPNASLTGGLAATEVNNGKQ